MKLRTGKYRYNPSRKFDEFLGARIEHKGLYFMLCVMPFVELLEMRNKNDTTRSLRGFPKFITIDLFN